MEWFNNLGFLKIEWSSLEQYHSLIWIALGCLLVYCIFLGATQKIIFSLIPEIRLPVVEYHS